MRTLNWPRGSQSPGGALLSFEAVIPSLREGYGSWARFDLLPACSCGPIVHNSRHGHYGLRLVRVDALQAVYVYCSRRVVVRFTGLNRAVTEVHRWVQRSIDLRVRSCGGGSPVDVVSTD